MKILLVAINAKFIHSNPAVYSLLTYAKKYAKHIEIREFSINQPKFVILSEIMREKPDAVCFSCYIWNMGYVLSLTDSIKKISRDTIILFGGPEVSYDSSYSTADYIISGEGEQEFLSFAESLIEKREFVRREHSPLALDKIDFIYEDRLDGFNNRIIYYETSRGCPYKCTYCLSSASGGVRFLSNERIIADFKYFLDHKVTQVKLVDRTFNANKLHAMSIWRYLIDNDNSVTNFHFEINGNLLDHEMLGLLKTARKGLFQFEIGVQSTNPKTLAAIERNNGSRLFENVTTLMAFGNINIHLDLIVGLPFEDYLSFGLSFNKVFMLRPDKLQIGFLKLLKGSKLRKEAEKYGIVYGEEAPYEVLMTDCLSFEEVDRLKGFEDMFEKYFNSAKFTYSLEYALKFFNSAFEFFEKLAAFWRNGCYHLVSVGNLTLYKIFYDFCSAYCTDSALLLDLIRFDLLTRDDLRSLPDWLNAPVYTQETKKFFDSAEIQHYLPEMNKKTLNRRCNIHKFSYNITGEQRETYYMFVYPGGTAIDITEGVGKL